MSTGLIAPGNRGGALAEAAASREVAEVQAAMMLAKRFPRDEKLAMDKIMVACQREGLAATAIYQYARGGTDISGPSIRLAETIARCWGNVHFGLREVEQRDGESTVEAYAIDLETNTRVQRVFQAKHIRSKQSGNVDLTDPRDIYELVANQGSRRTRACILALIPGDIIEAAVEQCNKTLKTKTDISPDRIKKMLMAFADLGVEKSQIEKKIQRSLDAITPAQVVYMVKIYTSIKDGMSVADDWFESVPVVEPDAPADNADTILAASKSKRGRTKAAEPKAEPKPDPKPADVESDAGSAVEEPAKDQEPVDGPPSVVDEWMQSIDELTPADGTPIPDLRIARRALAELSDRIEASGMTRDEKKLLHARIVKISEAIDDKTGGY
jgi:hypothetical protein